MPPITSPILRLLPGNNLGQLNSLSGQVALRITEACNYFPKGADVIKKSVDFNAFAALLEANMKLTFAVGARRGYLSTICPISSPEQGKMLKREDFYLPLIFTRLWKTQIQETGLKFLLISPDHQNRLK